MSGHALDANTKKDGHESIVWFRNYGRRLPPRSYFLQYRLRVIPCDHILRRIGQLFVQTARYDTHPLIMIYSVVKFHANVRVFPHALDLLSKNTEAV